MATVEISIDDLEFFEYVGGGSFGSVYRGFWKSHEQIVAIKKHTAPDSSKEVAILSKLSHRNIIQLYGAVTVNPHLCFVTEYASEGSLYGHLSQNTLGFPQILTWARQIALGMNYLHNEAPFPVIHRDLKSKNVVLSEDMTAKICDFGCARFMKNTTKMSLAGTFPWMAPEAIQQMAVDGKSDTFSYGVVVWELLTSEVPFKGLEGIQVAWVVVALGKRLTIPSSCPEKIASLMTSCWEENPKDRPDFRDILANLQLMSDDAQLPDATQSFLNLRADWRAEIETVLNDLKKVERNLSTREKELMEREMKLQEREREFNQRLEPKLPEDHDIAGWTEENVCQWIHFIAAEGGRVDLEPYGEVFLQNNITGQRLLQLAAEDLYPMIPSFGHRLDMQRAIEQLREHAERLRNFPPLSVEAASASRNVADTEPQVVNLTVIFGNHFRKGALPNQRKWKMYMELDGPDEAIMCIKCVHFTFAEDVITITQPPFLMDKWRSAERDTETVECVVEYNSSVKKPRRSSCKHTVDFTGSECVQVQQFSVLLTLKRSMACAAGTDGASSRRGSVRNSSLRDSGCFNTSEPPSYAGSVNSERSSQPRFDNLPGLQPRKVAWPSVSGRSRTPERPRTIDPIKLSPAATAGVSPSAVSPASLSSSGGSGNPWFGHQRLSWPSGSPAKTVIARGPTIPATLPRRTSDQTAVHTPRARGGGGGGGGAMQRQTSSPMVMRGGGAAGGGGRGGTGHVQRGRSQRGGFPAGGDTRPLGDSRTLPSGQGHPHATQVRGGYRRSVSDIQPQQGSYLANTRPWPGHGTGAQGPYGRTQQSTRQPQQAQQTPRQAQEPSSRPVQQEPQEQNQWQQQQTPRRRGQASEQRSSQTQPSGQQSSSSRGSNRSRRGRPTR